MSTVRSLALGAMMIAGVAGVSAAQSASSTPRVRSDSAWHRRGPAGVAGARRGEGEFRFANDLNLTDAQKAQIKAIRTKYQPQNQALRDRAKPYFEAARTAREKGDTAAVRSNLEQARQVMQGGQSIRTQENGEIRAILTPAQQAKWDTWQKNMEARRADGGRGMHKGFRRGEGRRARSGSASSTQQ